MDNVRFEAAGINTDALDVPQGSIANCRFDIDSPFIINRHRLGDQLLEYAFSAGVKSFSSPYTVKALGQEKSVSLERNLEITLQ